MVKGVVEVEVEVWDGGIEMFTVGGASGGSRRVFKPRV
jgi:hypothetical protein